MKVLAWPIIDYAHLHYFQHTFIFVITFYTLPWVLITENLKIDRGNVAIQCYINYIMSSPHKINRVMC